MELGQISQVLEVQNFFVRIYFKQIFFINQKSMWPCIFFIVYMNLKYSKTISINWDTFF